MWRRLELEVLDDTLFESVTLFWRPVAPNTIKLNLTMHRLLKQINLFEVHFSVYRRFATWQRFPINFWENICDMLDPKKFTPLLDVIHENLKPYSNMVHPCPYRVNETLAIRTNKFNISEVKVPLMPAGRYHADFNWTTGRNRKPFVFLQFYFEISDHRVEQY